MRTRLFPQIHQPSAPLVAILALGLPLAGQDRSPTSNNASRKIIELKTRIEADNRNNPVATVTWAEEALGLLAREKNPGSEAWFLRNLVRALNTLGDYPKAHAYLARAREQVSRTGDSRDHLLLEVEGGGLASNENKPAEAKAHLDELLPAMVAYGQGHPQDIEFGRALARGYRIQGAACRNLGRFAEAITAFAKGQKACEQIGDRAGKARILDLTGTLYTCLGRFDEAIAAHKEAIAAAETLADVDLQANCHLSLANTYGSNNQTDAQLAELTLAEKLAARAQDPDIRSICGVNLADVYLRKKDYKSTLKYAETALKLLGPNPSPSSVAVCQVNRGIALNRLGDKQEGIKAIQEGLAFFKESQALSDTVEITGNLAEEYAFSGDYRKAYETEVQFKALNDSLMQAADRKRIAEASAAFENDRNQLQIKALQRDRAYQARTSILWIALGFLGFATASLLVIARKKLQRTNKSLEDMSLKDPLTALGNRRYLTTRIAEDLAQINRMQRIVKNGATPDRLAINIDVTFLMIDLDHFKRVNDQYGHLAGDQVLKQVGQILTQTMRESDTVIRWGGEEFLVVTKPTSHLDAHLVAERIRSLVEEHRFDLGNDQSIFMTCSVGFSSYPFYRTDPSSVAWEKVTDVADQCLYAAKAMGRNTWVGVHESQGSAQASQVDLPNFLHVPTLVNKGILVVESRKQQPVDWAE